LLTVYRPSTTTLTLQFYEEFASVLEDLITRNSQLLILGDFNIHLEDSASLNSLHFSQLLAQFGLHQHISEPTRGSGGWLDLVITSDEEQILDLHVLPPTVSESSLSYHQYTCSQFTLYECYMDGKLLIHKLCSMRLASINTYRDSGSSYS